ncbi:MAG: glycosyltransferase family 2 protein [Patescibacteria group bacterium]
MATLSVVLATFNEEKNLSECLQSVKDLADEIVIVDGGSKDQTVIIAKDFKAKVIETTNPAIFHINKQKAIDGATKDWILQLDADERVSPELAVEIKDKIGSSHINGYWIPRKNFFLGRFLKKGGQYPDYTLRLYKRGKGRLPQKSVHEQAEVQGEVGYLKNPLIHMADPQFSRYLSRFDRYTNLIAKEYADQKLAVNPLVTGNQMLILPLWWFFLSYVRHKGFVDSWQGFVFSFFSALRFPVSYVKYIKSRRIL